MTVARATRRPSSSQSSTLGMTLGSPALIAWSATPVLDGLGPKSSPYSIDLKRENAARMVFEEALGPGEPAVDLVAQPCRARRQTRPCRRGAGDRGSVRFG